jgi:hypothetical protein
VHTPAKHTRLFCGAVLVACVGALARAAEPPAAKTAAGEVTLNVVKYADLIAAVKANRGKVIVVDVWAEY